MAPAPVVVQEVVQEAPVVVQQAPVSPRVVRTMQATPGNFRQVRHASPMVSRRVMHASGMPSTMNSQVVRTVGGQGMVMNGGMRMTSGRMGGNVVRTVNGG